MNVKLPDRPLVNLPDSPLRRLLWGAFEGTILGTALYVPAVMARVAGPKPSWSEALPFLVVGAVVCAAGQYLARGILGACVGLVAGALIGSMALSETPPSIKTEALYKQVTVAGVTLSGDRLDVKDLRGKVVLVDFWATWCPPCREEIPRLKALYAEHHAAGLEIVGVNLDTNRESVVKFVQKQEIPWPQLFFDDPEQQGWHNPVLAHYGIYGIPNTLLVDREGWIVANGLVGSRLQDAIERVMVGEKPRDPLWANLANPLTNFLAAAGWLGGMLFERRFRQLARRNRPEGQA
jgi:thiol-disulfide isomerase/thioredoxin